jgi:GNAT superfamily N-acetyltransferase
LEGLSIRDLKAGDAETLAQMAVDAWRPIYASYRGILGDDLFTAAFPNWEEKKAGQIRTACAEGSRASVYVAEKGGQIVGFVTFYLDQSTNVGEIGNNAVSPDWQGQGIGTAMYERVFEALRSRGVRVVKVGTGGDPSHAPARRAYEKAGFTASLPSVTYYRKL